MQKTLGGDRLGSGKKQKVELHNYERATFDLSHTWRSTMAAGTLVPFLKLVAKPGDTFDIDLNCNVKTHPTIGPLFGSYKVQLDVFQCPWRLYIAQLHNNKLGIGLDMKQVKLPTITLNAAQTPIATTPDLDNSQINPSCILSYLGIRGVGKNETTNDTALRDFNAIPLIAYWDIYKNYYSNKMEEIGAVIHTLPVTLNSNMSTVFIKQPNTTAVGIVQAPTNNTDPRLATPGTLLTFTYTSGTPQPENLIFIFNGGQRVKAIDVMKSRTVSGQVFQGLWDDTLYGNQVIQQWDFIRVSELPVVPPIVDTFPLANIDTAREKILQHTNFTTPFNINTDLNIEPYVHLITASGTGGFTCMMQTQEGLGLKTYQSDLFNNWLKTSYIDTINTTTAVSTAGNTFTIDALQLAKKVYDMLNRVAVSGGTYDDWLDVIYMQERITRAETPIYMGGLSKELVFQEVVSNAASGTEGSGNQPLGTLAGKGIMADKHKGGHITIKVDEPSYIIGIISLTPRLDYSQGNDWDTHLQTVDDLHKPGLDGIGFQDLITEQFVWWDTFAVSKTGNYGNWVTHSAGKQPAWINYMTEVNKVKGNFAIKDNEMFMTLNRRYEYVGTNIFDLTTYIDPIKFNHIFADTARDAQNFWTQVAIDITARRKQSAKVMPNL